MQNFLAIPDAKPLLSKNIIDLDKAKILIKEIEFLKEPLELLSSNIAKDIFPADKNHNAKQIPSMKNK